MQCTGECVSVDQSESPTQGLIAQLRGIPTKERYKTATVFIVHVSQLSYVHLQKSTNADETEEAKVAHEKDLQMQEGQKSSTDMPTMPTTSLRHMWQVKVKHLPFVASMTTFLKPLAISTWPSTLFHPIRRLSLALAFSIAFQPGRYNGPANDFNCVRPLSHPFARASKFFRPFLVTAGWLGAPWPARCFPKQAAGVNRDATVHMSSWRYALLVK
jgi:hypothetical protein